MWKIQPINLQLKKANGAQYATDPESFHLTSQELNSKTLLIVFDQPTQG